MSALGTGAASVLFGVALLASGQNSSVTGTLAGQVVMEGFTGMAIPPKARRLVTRLTAIIPATIAAYLFGAAGITRLLILSQVVLSLQLPFAAIPLVRLTGDPLVMGELASSSALKLLAWAICSVIVVLTSYEPGA